MESHAGALFVGGIGARAVGRAIAKKDGAAGGQFDHVRVEGGYRFGLGDDVLGHRGAGGPAVVEALQPFVDALAAVEVAGHQILKGSSP